MISDQWEDEILSVEDLGQVKTGRETLILRFVAESASAPLKHPQEAAGLRGTKLGVRVTKEPTKHELTRVPVW